MGTKGGTYSVEERQVPVVWQALPCNRVCLAADSKDSLDSDVHNHQTLSTKAVGQNLESVCDQQTGPGERVEDAKDPDEGDLRVAGACVLFTRVLVNGARDGPADEVDDHTYNGSGLVCD